MSCQLACSLLARFPSAARSNPRKSTSFGDISTILSGELMDHKLLNKYGLQIEGRTEKGNPNPATHLNTEIANNDFIYSTSRPLRLTASGRHPGETMHIINQLKFKPGHSKPLRRTSAASWQAGHSSKEATDFEEAPPTDHLARRRGQHRGFRGPTAWPRREEARQRSQLQGPRVAWPTSRPADSARGRLQGPRVAWPTSRPASCVADVRPVQAVAECKHERKGAGAEVEEARAGRALPAPTTRHPRRRSRTTNTRRASRHERRVRIIASNFCFKMTSLAA